MTFCRVLPDCRCLLQDFAALQRAVIAVARGGSSGDASPAASTLSQLAAQDLNAPWPVGRQAEGTSRCRVVAGSTSAVMVTDLCGRVLIVAVCCGVTRCGVVLCFQTLRLLMRL